MVVLVDYPSRMSARVHQRVSARHVATAISAARRALPGTPVVVRPHPSDAEPGAYGALGSRVDATTGIEQLLERCSLCIGSVSTATLQSAAMGIPTIQLDVSGADDRPWPLDGSVLPRARDEDELVAMMAGRIEGSAESARVALGARRGATSAVVDLITELIAPTNPQQALERLLRPESLGHRADRRSFGQGGQQGRQLGRPVVGHNRKPGEVVRLDGRRTTTGRPQANASAIAVGCPSLPVDGTTSASNPARNPATSSTGS